MRSRAARVTLTLLAVAGVATAAYMAVGLERARNAAATQARELDARMASASRQVLELRASQQAYVAVGQSEQFWITKAAATLAAARESLTAIRTSVTTAASQLALDEALQSLQEFERMDRRARDYAVNGQKLLASDLVFSDGLETTGQVLASLDQARELAAADLAGAQASAGREQLIYGAVAGALAALVLLVLMPLPRQEEAAAPPAALAPAAIDTNLDLRQSFGDIAAVVAPAPVPPPAPAVDLETVAAVCTDLARISDTTSLPSLLERTATALDATGIVLWIADPDGKELTPTVSHGYPASMLSRMGTIAREADNVTAAAFRTGLLQVVAADTMSNGAIAAPLVNPGGCIGVMSAEVRHDGEQQPSRLAVATIVAAQLATLVAPPAARDNRTAAI